MRKAVEEYLEERGYRSVRQPAEPVPPATLLPAQEATPDGLTDAMRAKLVTPREAARTILGECEETLISLVVPETSKCRTHISRVPLRT